jgi:hypothetical protein
MVPMSSASMSRPLGAKNKKTLAREAEQRRLAAIGQARCKVSASKGALDPTIATDSLSVFEETMRFFYFKARI